MRKYRWVTIASGIVLFSSSRLSAQTTDETIAQLNSMIDDAIFFTDRYITPATDAIAYQAAAGWMATPKKANRWDFTLSANFNTFFVPQSQRHFLLKDEDLSFFTIDDVPQASTPTALGGDQVVSLTGQLNGEPVTLESPEGVNRETILYPYLQGSLGVGYGTEIIGRFAPRIVLKHVDFQIYGIGIKHNLSQYFPKMETKKWHLAATALYSKEDVTVEFLDVITSFGNLGLNGLHSDVNSWQVQLGGSKELGKWEVSASIVGNTSHFKYDVQGERGQIEDILPLHDILNKELESIYKTQFNLLGEMAGRYTFAPFYVQGFVGFGKYINTNLSLQYQF